MTRDDIIKLARESGLHSAVLLAHFTEKALTATEADQLEAIIDFAERVAKVERGACADLCKYVYTEVLDDSDGAARMCESYIRSGA